MYAVDIETHDPSLLDFGPGSIRKDGHILGVGVVGHGVSKYFTVDDPQLLGILASHETKVFHNGVYDLDWLVNGAGLTVNGKIEDTMTREYLLDAYAGRYNLDTVAKKYRVEGKFVGEIEQWCRDHGLRGKAQSHLAQVPAAIVGKYCVQDCQATLSVYSEQQPLLEAQNLIEANDIEAALYPLLLAMRRNGIRVDLAARSKLSDTLNIELENVMKGLNIDSLMAPSQLTKLFEKEGVPIPKNANGRNVFNEDALSDIQHPIIEQLLHARRVNTALNKYVDGYCVDYRVGDRIHPVFYPALRDAGGTITGRFSSQNPNLQNIPARGYKFGKEIRSLFIPDYGCCLGAFDYKQIEYRVFTHFASGPGAEEAREKFRNDVTTDYHQLTMDMLGWVGKEGRHIAKNLNFGSIYGLGYKSFAVRFRNDIRQQAEDAQLSIEDFAQVKMAEYFNKLTFVRPTCRKIQEVGTKRGYVKTVSGRRQRLPSDGKAYKLINYLVQGSAGDILKRGLVAAWSAGIFDILRMHVTVHDENVFSIPDTKAGWEAAAEFAHIMETATKLTIPLLVDRECGPDWGHCTGEFYEENVARVLL